MEKLLVSHTGYEVKEARILRTSRLTEKEKLFELSLVDGEILDF